MFTILPCLCVSADTSRTNQQDSVQDEGLECHQVDFLNDAAAEIPFSWRKFGLCLGIDYEKLDAVEEDCQNDDLLCFTEVYSIWRKEQCKPVTWATVVEILEKPLLKETRLSQKLRRKYSVA